jgi:threonylcarbamoyladenosine tRNA methylthiotransferase MtaB
MRVFLASLGCKVNAYETEAVAELFRVRGHTIVGEGDPADAVVLNTCTVTNVADQKSRQAIRRLAAAHPGAAVVVMGCYAQLQAEKVAAVDGVSVVLGTRDRHLVPELTEEFLKERKRIVAVGDPGRDEAFEGMTIRAFAGHRRAFLKIEDGCDNFCSYCVIPFARGRVRSKAPETVLREAEELARSGFGEIVLTGIHTGGYGGDLDGYRFADLLRDLGRIEGIRRIRISSIEESELTEEVIGILAEDPRFARHLHIPLQSGSDRVLKAMNRRYDTNEYARKIATIRDRMPGVAVTTDVIAGFPGETESDFTEELAFLRAMKFSELHVFPFSRREGTVAAKLPDQIDEATKKRRVRILLALSDELARTYVAGNVGIPLAAIAETWKDGFLEGHTGNYLRVRFAGSSDLIGRITTVRIIREEYPLSPALIIA